MSLFQSRKRQSQHVSKLCNGTLSETRTHPVTKIFFARVKDKSVIPEDWQIISAVMEEARISIVYTKSFRALS
jgi:hypothetical protein